MVSHQEKKRLRVNTYIAGFLLSIHLSLTGYINSSFLSSFLSYETVGLVFSIAALLGILGLYLLPILLKSIDLIETISALTFCLIIVVLLMVNSSQNHLSIGFFASYYVISLLVSYLIDLYLEENSDDNITGQIRSFFISIIHVAMIFSVLVVGSLLKNSDNYQIVYIFSLLPLLPLIYLAGHKLKKVSLAISQEISWREIYNNLKNPARGSREANIKNILVVDYLINLFYTFMVVYLPIYLNQYLGMPWSSIGLIFGFMLLPFLIFPYPLGLLADKRLGEKEILTGALIITSLSTILMSTLTLPSIFLWSVILFINRVGSCSVETMKESYLFKQISSGDIGIISVSRNTRPLAAVTGPLMATIVLLFFPFPFLFTFMGFLLLVGIYPTLVLKDTK